MYFITRGEVEVVLQIDNARTKRLTTLAAGMTFGDLAMLSGEKRVADVRTLTDTTCLQLKFTDIDPATWTKMLTNLARILAAKLDREAVEITTLY